MKRALVTGASGDIGASIAQVLSDQGFWVVIHAYQSIDKAEALAERISRSGGSASIVCFDLTDTEATDRCLTDLVDTAPIDVIVHSAGIHDDAPMAGMTSHQWHSVIDVSLNGFYNVTRPLLMPMIRQRWGRIIGLSSIAGITGNRGQANYAAAKAGLIGACKSLATELASRNVLVNVVAPGIIESQMTQGLFDKETLGRLVPMGRAGQPEDVAHLVAFLASEKSSYITGQVFGVNGGMI